MCGNFCFINNTVNEGIVFDSDFLLAIRYHNFINCFYLPFIKGNGNAPSRFSENIGASHVSNTVKPYDSCYYSDSNNHDYN